MNTFKIFLYTYRQVCYYALMPIGFFIIMIVAQACMPTSPLSTGNMAWLCYFIFPLSLTNVYTLLYEKKLLYLLPVSRSTKFFMPLCIGGLIVALTYLLTIPIEAVAHVFTIGNAPEQQIAIGGFLKYGFAHNIMVFTPFLIACAFVFIQSLIRNKFIFPVIIFVTTFLFVKNTPDIFERLMHSPAMSTNAIIGCLAACVLLIAASYQIFKRWQPANDGLLKI